MSKKQWAMWALRVGVAGEFAGHGLLAIGGKADWISWMGKFGVSDAHLAAQLLVAVGVVDLLVALTVLVKPLKPILLYAAFWGFWTALVRPIVGVGWLDFIERWANWAAPLALYWLMSDER
jgi:hypothetical protein